jgi:hypothetical protein
VANGTDPQHAAVDQEGDFEVNRRGFFGLLLAPLAAPILKILPAKEATWWVVGPDKPAVAAWTKATVATMPISTIPISPGLIGGEIYELSHVQLLQEMLRREDDDYTRDTGRDSSQIDH